jgi:hypothetical protein
MESADAYGPGLAGIDQRQFGRCRGWIKLATRGLSVVQDPAEARMPAMPEAAIRASPI